MTKRALHLPARSGKPPLALLDAAAKALGQCVRVDAAKGIRDIAVAFQTYAKQAKDTRLVERATEVRVEAELVAAIRSLDMKAKGRRQKVGDNQRGSKTGLLPPSLDDLGITKMQASRWQKLAIMKLAFPKNWEERLRRMCAMAIAITEGDKAVIAAARADLHAEKKRTRDKHERELAEKIYALPAQRFGVILADPPWKFIVGSEKGLTRTSAANHYAVSELADIQRSTSTPLPPPIVRCSSGPRSRRCRMRWRP